ncbi:protein phosphatase 2C domain-containing protein [Actinomadura sp. NPDC047616]|uniref:protein phosphatase 2C domain-containing protein n=1 Tax=Actinomadura sp. NPDC047616 TaxID=3155914 RepID=UPI0033EC6179
MRITYASEATPGRLNEDYVVAGPEWVVLLDGATAAPGVDSGCGHGPAWLVRRLAGGLAARLAVEDGAPLQDLLADTVKATGEAHAGTCDLDNPDSPSATVAMLRRRDGVLDWLVLADSPVLLQMDGQVRVVHDDRVDRLPAYTVEAVRAARNSPGGFWVAGNRPEAAYEALTGEAPAERVRRAAVLSDGAARLVQIFGRTDWAGLLDLLDGAGPVELIRRTREAETTATIRRGKRHDDATAVLVRP